MLAVLRIKNLALVEEMEWSPGPGFNAITGETGTGKSVLIGALKLVLGERADKTLIRSGAESCTVEAVFELEDAAALNVILEEQGIERCTDGVLILKRVFTQTGANRQFLNCCATTLAVLKKVGDGLVDLHGPHDHQSLLSCDKQMEVLDAFAGAETLRSEFAGQFRKINALLAERDELSAGEATLERELELLRHQVAEIGAADLKPGEEAPLLQRYGLASNSRRLTEISTAVVQRLSEADDAVLSRLAEVQRLLRELEKIDPKTNELQNAHASAVMQIEEIAQSVREYSERLEIDPGELAGIEERISLFETLKRKYGGSLEMAVEFGAKAAERLGRIESRGDELQRLERELEAGRRAMLETGAKLSKKRAGIAPKLAKEIKTHLADLGFRKSEFELTLQAASKPHAGGLETVEFFFAPNPGEPLKPLKAIASSGEISRVMLAVKTALATQDEIPLLVFDEIDANVGGEVAHAVGAKMKSLGEGHQVLCITHLPQVAAAAKTQFVVTKEFREGRTVSQLTEVRDHRRVEELARMLGGKSDSAVAHARVMLGDPA